MTLAKPDDYYRNVRREILPLIPARAGKVLEIGCGAGNTLKYLKEAGRADWVAGVEISSAADEAAQAGLDMFWPGDVAAVLKNPAGPAVHAPFDVILCLDVLEHLVDPWAVLGGLAELLAGDGSVVAALPNVRFYKVAARLLFEGRWDYEESGVLDSTHLRFFTRASIRELFEGAGLAVTDMVPVANMKPWRNKWIFNKLSGNRLIDIYAYSYIVRAARA